MFTIFAPVFVLSSLFLLSGASSSNASQITQEFQGSLSPGAQILFPSDSNYTSETTQRWTIYDPPTYVAAIKPATEGDVQQIVQIAAKNNLPYLATGGGHGISVTLANVQNGIAIDLGNFKNVTVDEAASTVTVGGGNHFRDVIEPVYKAGKELPTGSCACVGVLGATVGGGVGRLQGIHGLITDSLISVIIVTADGKILTASETENSDLFWGIRGAGANFGIILWATYKIYDLTNGGMALNADFIWPASANLTFFENYKKLIDDFPKELALFAEISYNESRGGLNILANAVYYGPEADGRALLKPFIDSNPTTMNITYLTADKVIEAASWGMFWDAECAKGHYIDSYTVGTKEFDVPTFATHIANMSKFYDEFPQARASTVFLEGFAPQGAVNQPKNQTCVPDTHREIKNHVLWGYNYNDKSIDTAVNNFARDARQAFITTSGFDDFEVYDTYSHGDEGAEVWYRDNLPNLKALKERYDPTGQFKYMNPIV